MKRSFADIMAGLDSDRARKVARKLPEWAAAGAEIPSALSLEQCSSSATAAYKAALAGQAAAATNLRFAHPPQPGGWVPPVHEATGGHGFAAALPVPADQRRLHTVLDLTGGLGVDSHALSQVAERVVYYERNAELAAAAERNFRRLGAGNIEVHCETVTPETDLPEADLIYADPARRDTAGRKVFLLEDCTPDILTLLPTLFQKAPAVLLKLSPMADLAMLAERLGPTLQEIHVVELDGEVKELLCLLVRDAAAAEPCITVVRLSGQAAGTGGHGFATALPDPAESIQLPKVARFPGAVAAGVPLMADTDRDVLRFQSSEERAAEAVYAAGVQAGELLLEPCPALLKAGAFRLPCARWGLRKLAPSTHLYLLPSYSSHSGLDQESRVPPFFKAWRITEVLPFGVAAFKDLRRRYPRAEVTARNLPLGSDALRQRLGVAPGGAVHIFGCRLADGSAVLLVTTAA